MPIYSVTFTKKVVAEQIVQADTPERAMDLVKDEWYNGATSLSIEEWFDVDQEIDDFQAELTEELTVEDTDIQEDGRPPFDKEKARERIAERASYVKVLLARFHAGEDIA